MRSMTEGASSGWQGPLRRAFARHLPRFAVEERYCS